MLSLRRGRGHALDVADEREVVRTVMSRYSGGSSGMYPICFLTACGSSRMSCPSSFTEPSVAER